MNLQDELKDLQDKHLWRELLPLSSPQEPEVSLYGKKYTLFCSNNYLGLANDERLSQAAFAAGKNYGWGAGASRLLSGNTRAHEALEKSLALFKGTQAALVFGSGYLTNVGCLPALTGEKDVILSDALNHASLIDGCRLSRAKVQVYPHRDLNALETLLQQHRPGARRCLIVTESVFSMEGSLAPLREILALAKRYDADVYLDDAHGFGVLGNEGRGALEHFGLSADSQLVQMATLGKALGSFGGFIAGSHDLRALLINKARTFIFATAFPAAVAAAASAALKIVSEEQPRRYNLRKNCQHLAQGLRRLGCDLPPEADFIPIQPIVVGDEERALWLAEKLFEEGILARAIRPPTVAPDQCRVRFSLMATHQTSHIDALLEVLGRLL